MVTWQARQLWVFLLCFTLAGGMATPSWAQKKLLVSGGLDSTSVSTKMKNGQSSARIIVRSGVRLHYRTNMESVIPSEQVKRSKSRGIYADTLYFYPQEDDNVRMLYLEAPSFFTERIGPLRLYPKRTYAYFVYDSLYHAKYGALPQRRVSWHVHAGVTSWFNESSIGYTLQTGVSVRLWGDISLVPCLSYTGLFVYPEGSRTPIVRRFPEGQCLLRYNVGRRFALMAGYARSWMDLHDNAVVTKCQFRWLPRAVAGAQATYYFGCNYTMASLYLGIEL